MYLILNSRPYHAYGNQVFLAPDRARQLRLLRNSFDGKFGQLTLLAPSVPPSSQCSLNLDCDEGRLQAFDTDTEDIRVESSFQFASANHACNAKDIAKANHPTHWKKVLQTFTRSACVLQPEILAASDSAIANGISKTKSPSHPIVLVHNHDSQRVLPAHPRTIALRNGWSNRRFRRNCERLVQQSELSLFSSETSMRHFSRYARNSHVFCEPAISLTDVIPEEELRERFRGDMDLQPLRLVSYAPLERPYGVNLSIAIIRYARDLGADVCLDIFGHGLQRSELQYQIAKLGLTREVRFQQHSPDAIESLQQQRQYDAMLFTPMIDCDMHPFLSCYSSGLPMLGFDHTYFVNQLAADNAGMTLPKQDLEQAGHRIAELELHRGQLFEMSLNARQAACRHTRESWYAKRAEWTLDAIPRFPRVSTSDASPPDAPARNSDPALSGLPT
ncbi:hypothetical protein SH528x_001141 [Novipirellula sp. SH528]|uniref:hypothetical protein n=1 Tax=Novipirellula sp. SH528 TaxID=3454466 RepID=UPI003FA0174C